MATPPENASSTSHDRDIGSVVDNSIEIIHSERPHFNIFPSAPPLTFSTTDQSVQNASITAQHPSSNRRPSDDSSNSQSVGGPRRGSFPDILPHGHTIPPLIDARVTASSGGASGAQISGPPVYKLDKDDLQTDSDPDFRYSTGMLGMAPTSASNPPAQNQNDDFTITVASQSAIPADHSNSPSASETASKPSSSRRNKQYLLSNGAVVSGKGLGRGRPGVKRGPRNLKYQMTEDGSQQAAVDTSDDIVKPPNKKRKSGDSDIIKTRSSTSRSVTAESRGSSEEYNPTGQTRSGRQIQKPFLPLTNTNTASASPSKASRAGSNHTSTPSSTIKTHPKIKRRIYRGREQFALCEHCLRGHGPPGNVIVFCDACNKCWHQRCHDPQISKQTVSDTKADWFCADCDRILHGKKAKKPNKSEAGPPAASAPVAPVTPVAPVYAGPRVGGRFMPPTQKLAYLNTLSKENMVSLLMQASDLAPDLPLFQTLVAPPQPPKLSPAQFTSTYVTPVTNPPAFLEADAGEAVDEGYDGHYDEHAALYPKTGQGIQLPPEREDLHILLEGKTSRTFSHWVRGMPGKEYSGSGNIPTRR
nr:hypothetical protein LTR18_007718 [Exophiala xenobiotica]